MADDTPQTYDLAGVDVPRIGLGTNLLRDTAEGVAFIRAAIDAGVGHVDTAHLYADGASERAIGAAGAADDVLVATKGGYGGAGRGRPGAQGADRAEPRVIADRRGSGSTTCTGKKP